MPQDGVVYLIHLSRPYRHARHYLGWTQNLEQRLREHRAGRGSPLLAAAIAAGIELELAASWPGDRHEERRLHRYHNTPRRLCPICKAQHANNDTAAARVDAAGGGAGVAGAPRDAVDELVLAAMRDCGEPVALPTLAAALRDSRGGRPVGSLHGRLELLARNGHARKTWAGGEIAWATVSG